MAAAVNEASLRAQISATEDIAGSQQRQLDITQRRVAAGPQDRREAEDDAGQRRQQRRKREHPQVN